MRYFFIAFIFWSCNHVSQRGDSQDISTTVLDTINTSTSGLETSPVIFETAFMKGTTKKVENSIISFYGVTIGKVKIVSGRIIACDPMHIEEYGKPFTQLFPTGEFPVQLSILKLDYEESIAFARIYFSGDPVYKWEFALLKGQLPIPVGGKKMHGYSVDAGVGVFIDEDAYRMLNREELTRMDAPLYKEMEKRQHNGWRYALFNFGEHNLASFSTGLGDGYYATYIGFDANGKPCRLLTDFGLIDWKTK